MSNKTEYTSPDVAAQEHCPNPEHQNRLSFSPESDQDLHDIIRDWLQIILADDQCVELRALGVHTEDFDYPVTVSGLFDPHHRQELVEEAVKLSDDGRAKGVYLTLNPVDPSFAKQPWNQIHPARKGNSVGDEGILARRWLLIDLDRVKPQGTSELSATDAEKQSVQSLAEAVKGYLDDQGWPEPVVADSGNGVHFLYRIDLAAEDGGLVERVLKALAGMFNNSQGTVDTSVFNPSRIVRLYGTWARKGEDTGDRPHRRARVVSIPEPVEVVDRGLLEALAALAPHDPQRRSYAGDYVSVLCNDRPEVMRRAKAYLNKVPPAIQGQAGDRKTFKAACKLVQGFGLSKDHALPLLEAWNKACVPPWEGKDLERKLDEAAKRCKDPGYLLRDEVVDDPFRLARLFLAEEYKESPEKNLVYWRGDWYEWQSSVYKALDANVLTLRLTTFIKKAFDADYQKEIAAWASAQSPNKCEEATGGLGKRKKPSLRKVSLGLVENTRHMLASLCVQDAAEAPFWLNRAANGANAREIIAAPNGLLVVTRDGGQRKLLAATPDFFTTVGLDYRIDLNAGSPTLWLAFLEELWPGDRESHETLQEWFGYCLVPDTSQQKILFLIGPPRSGKGLIGRVLTHLIGPGNVASPTLSSFGRNFGLSPLLDKYLSVVADARLLGRVNTAQILEHLLSISGEDYQTIDRKYRDPLTVKLLTRLMILANFLPPLADASLALAARTVLLQLRRSWIGSEDPELTDKILGERPGILIWALEGLSRLRRRGKFIQPASGQEKLQHLRELSSPVHAFVEQCCVADPDASTDKIELFRHWALWAEARKIQVQPENVFASDLYAACPLVSQGRPRRDGERVCAFNGIRLRTRDEGYHGEGVLTAGGHLVEFRNRPHRSPSH
jgi:putative DNA primase/helicase